MKFSTSRHLGLAWSAGAATALCVCLLGCKSEKEVADTAPPVATIAAAPTALPSPTGPAWTAAQGEDALTLQALAEAEGATELLRYVRAPGPAQALALQAITFAPDAEIALGGLAEAAATAPSGAGPAHRLALLTAISDIAGRPQAPTELIDPGGVRACAGTMVLLASRSDLSASERAMAKTAARRLARKGYIDPSRVDR